MPCLISKTKGLSCKGFPKRLQQHKATAKHRRKQNLGLKRFWEIYDYAFSPQLGQKLNSCLKSSTNEAATIPQPSSLIQTLRILSQEASGSLSEQSHSASGGGPGVLQRPAPPSTSWGSSWANNRLEQVLSMFAAVFLGTMAPFPSTPLWCP